MKKRQDTKPNKSVEELKFEMITDDFLICENLIRKRTT